MSRARDVAQRVLSEISSSDAFATRTLARAIESFSLDGRDAALTTELTLGVLRHRLRLDIALAAATSKGKLKASTRLRAVLRIAAYELLFLDGVPVRATIHEAVGAAKRIGGPRMAGLANAVLHSLEKNGEPVLPDDRRAALTITESIPPWLLSELERALDEDSSLESACEAFNQIPPICLRPNSTRTSRETAIAEIPKARPRAVLTGSPLAPMAIVCRNLGAIGSLEAFVQGRVTVQDVGAQMVGNLVHGDGVRRILDACAGVGGKTTHLAERFGGAVAIDGVDISESKLERLEASCARLGIDSVTPRRLDMLEFPADCEPYDAVVLDAPCSGLGVLRRHPEAKWRLTVADIDRMVELQRKLLKRCASVVAIGGQLVYAVCSFVPREGELQIQGFLGEHPGWQMTSSHATWPHRDNADGFFAAHLVRRS